MKNLILIILVFLNVLVFSQSSQKKIKYLKFTQKVLKKRATQLVLKKVINDSRCPEGVNCIWSGECEIEVEIYKNRKLIGSENVLISPKFQKENLVFFEKYYPKLKITEISVLPYPKSEVVANPKDFFVKIYYE